MKRFIKYFGLVGAVTTFMSACDSSPTSVDVKPQHDFVFGTGTKTYTVPITGPNGADMAFQYVTPQGGRISAGGHELIVPAGAIAQPTWFLMQVVASDRIQVKLKAWRGSDWASVSQFPATAPIQLNLNVSRVTDIDLSQLVVVYLADGTIDGRKEPQRSVVNPNTKILTGYLTHFSMYAVGREYIIGMDRSDNSGSGSYDSGSGSTNSGSGSYSSGSGSGY